MVMVAPQRAVAKQDAVRASRGVSLTFVFLMIASGLAGIAIIPGATATASSATGCTEGPAGIWTCTTTGADSYTPGSSIPCVKAEAWGGGGGGGNGPYDDGGGGGGAGAGYAQKYIVVSPGTPYTANVGVGGLGGAAGTGDVQNPGGRGGDSWFSSSASMLAKGGNGGGGGAVTGATAGGTSQAGNIGTTTNIGGNGGAGAAYNAATKSSGGGGGAGGPTGPGGSATNAGIGAGNSPGADGAAGRTATFGNGIAGGMPGGGGSGGLQDNTNTANYAGGNGGNGQIVITESSLAGTSTVTAAPAGVIADGTSTSTVTVKLQTLCGAVSGKAVTLTSSRGVADIITGPSPATTDASGQTTFTVKSSTCGTAILTATDTTDGVTVTQTANMAFATTGNADAAASTAVASPTAVYAGIATSTITVTLNAGACTVFGKTVSLSSSRGALDTITGPTPTTTGANGKATFTVSSATPGTSTYTAIDLTDSFAVTQQPSVAFVAFTGALTFAAQPSYTHVDLPFLPVVAVRVVPTSGSASGVTVTLAISGSPAGVHLEGGPGQNTNAGATPAPTALTNSAGVAVFSGLAIDTVGTYRLVASAGSATPATSASFNVGTAMPDWPQFHGNAQHSGIAVAPADFTGQTASNLPVPGGPVSSVQIADLDMDGWLDIVAVNDFNTVNGKMTVQAYRQNPVTHVMASYWAKDIPIPGVTNLDPPAPGTSGFAMLTVGPLVSGSSTPYVVVLFNNVQGQVATINTAQLMVMGATDGTILGKIASSIPIAGLGPHIGDINGDGTPDIVYVANEGSSGNGYDVSAARLNTALPLGSQVVSEFKTAITTNAIGAGPMLAELRSSHAGLEIVVGDTTKLYLCTPTPTGTPPTFTAPTAANCLEFVAMAPAPVGLSAADLDGDGNLEIIANGASGNSIRVVKGSAASLAAAGAVVVETLGDGALANTPAIGEANGDGLLDILEAQSAGGAVMARGFAANLVTDLGKTPAAQPISTVGGVQIDANYPANAATASVAPDFLYSETAAGQVGWYSLANPPLSLGTVALGANPTSHTAVGDFSGDCRSDLAVGINGNVAIITSTSGSKPSAVSFGTFTTPGAWSALTDPDTSPGPGLRAKLAWSAPVDGGLPVVRYNVYRATTDPGAAAIAGSPVGTWYSGAAPSAASDTDVFVNSVPAPGDYYYKVTAVNCLGEGPQSTAAFLAEVKAPNSPKNLAATITKGATPAYTGGLDVTVSWDDADPSVAARPNGCGPVDTADTTDGYNVYRGATLIKFKDAAGSTPYSFVDVGVAPGTTYSYTVKSTNCVGEESAGVTKTVALAYPSVSSITAKPYGDPAYSLAGTAAKKVQLDWTAATTTASCNWIEGYRVYRGASASFTADSSTLLATILPSTVVSWSRGVIVPANPAGTQAQTYTDDGSVAGFSLVVGSTYYYKVTAVGCTGEGAASASDAAELKVPNAPAAPTRSGFGATVNLNWAAPTTGTPLPANNSDCNWMEGYGVYRSTDDVTYTRVAYAVGTPAWSAVSPRPTVPPTAPSGVPLTYTDNSPGTGFVYYKVSAVNCVGEGSLSPALTVFINKAPAFTATDPAAVSEDAGAQILAAWASGITAGSASEDTAGQSVKFTVTAVGTPGLFSSQPSVSTTGFTASPFTGVGTLTYTPAADKCGTSTFTVKITDDAGTPSTADDLDGTTGTYTITVTCANDAPTLNALVDVTINEDNTPVTGLGNPVVVALSGIGPGGGSDEASQTVSVTASSATPAVIPNPTPSYTTGATTGSISFTPVADACSATPVTITVTVTDNGSPAASKSQSFQVTVSCINDAPIFTKGTDQSVGIDSGLQTVTGWATGIAPGPATATDESSQSLAFTTTVLSTSGGNGLTFSTPPSVSKTSAGGSPFTQAAGWGTLSYASTTGKYGSATVQTCLQDTGASGGGNVNSVCATFVININLDLQANPNAYSANEDILLTVAAPGVLVGDSTPAGSTTSVVLVSGPSNAAAGSFVLNSDGSFTYKGAADFSGTDSFTYRLDQSAPVVRSSNTATVTITVNAVNDPPTLNALSSFTINEDNTPVTCCGSPITVALSGIGRGAADESTQTLAVTASSNNVAVIPNPTVTYTPSQATGTISMTPVADGCSATPVTITVTVTDSGSNTAPSQNSVSRTFTVTVTCVNDAPVQKFGGAVFGGTEAITIPGGSTFPFTGATAISVTDVDGGAGSITGLGSVTVGSGTLTASGAGLTGSGTAALSFTGTYTNWRAALATLAYVAPATGCGSPFTTLTIVTNDRGNSPAPLQQDSDTVRINVSCGLPSVPVLNTPTSPAPNVLLSWSTSTPNGCAVTGYTLYRSTSSPVTTADTAIPVGNVLSYADSGPLTLGLTYYYKLVATNCAGNSGLSNQVSVWVVVPPQSPVLAASTSANNVVLTWAAPSSDGGAAITSYLLYWKAGACNPTSPPATLLAGSPFASTVLTTTDVGRTYGATYCYAAKARNAVPYDSVAVGNLVEVTLPATPSSSDITVNAVESNPLTITLPGTGGPPLTFQVCTVSGDITVTGFGDSDNLVSYTAPVGSSPGPYFFHYKVTDGVTTFPASPPCMVATINVQPNRAPVAGFTNSTFPAYVDQSVSFSDTSTDPDGPIASWSWDFGDASTSTVRSPQHAFTAPGTYSVRLTVTDIVGAASTKVIRFVVNVRVDTTPASPPPSSGGGASGASPQADAGLDQSVAAGAHVVLHGLANGKEQGYFFAWRQVLGTPVDLQGADTAFAEFVAPALTGGQSAKLVFQLVTSDGLRTSAPDNVTITVTQKAAPPSANAGPTQTATPGQEVRLSASGSSDPQGLTLTYLWSQTQGEPVVLSDPKAPDPSFVVPAATENGVLVFRLEVSNGPGSATDSVQVLVAKKAVVVEKTAPVVVAPTTQPAPVQAKIEARVHQSTPGLGLALLGLSLLGVAFVRRRK